METPTATSPKDVARSVDELHCAQRLRFEVFNPELGEGLLKAYSAGLDVDPFDEFCDHLIVEELATGEIVGTYRSRFSCRRSLLLA